MKPKETKEESWCTSNESEDLDEREHEECMAHDDTLQLRVMKFKNDKETMRSMVLNENESNCMPKQYRHKRQSPYVTKPASYKTIDVLISTCDCSKLQATASIIETVRTMFGQSNWK